MFQPPPSKLSSQAITKANALPVLKFYLTPATKKFHETIQYILIFHDELGLGLIFIQTYLQ
jgi:hypothetical protein